jgi:hypothetical protein
MNVTFSFSETYFTVPDNCEDCGETSGLRKKIAVRPTKERNNEIMSKTFLFITTHRLN